MQLVLLLLQGGLFLFGGVLVVALGLDALDEHLALALQSRRRLLYLFGRSREALTLAGVVVVLAGLLGYLTGLSQRHPLAGLLLQLGTDLVECHAVLVELLRIDGLAPSLGQRLHGLLHLLDGCPLVQVVCHAECIVERHDFAAQLGGLLLHLLQSLGVLAYEPVVLGPLGVAFSDGVVLLLHGGDGVAHVLGSEFAGLGLFLLGVEDGLVALLGGLFYLLQFALLLLIHFVEPFVVVDVGLHLLVVGLQNLGARLVGGVQSLLHLLVVFLGLRGSGLCVGGFLLCLGVGVLGGGLLLLGLRHLAFQLLPLGLLLGSVGRSLCALLGGLSLLLLGLGSLLQQLVSLRVFLVYFGL